MKTFVRTKNKDEKKNNKKRTQSNWSEANDLIFHVWRIDSCIQGMIAWNCNISACSGCSPNFTIFSSIILFSESKNPLDTRPASWQQWDHVYWLCIVFTKWSRAIRVAVELSETTDLGCVHILMNFALGIMFCSCAQQIPLFDDAIRWSPMSFYVTRQNNYVVRLGSKQRQSSLYGRTMYASKQFAYRMLSSFILLY